MAKMEREQLITNDAHWKLLNAPPQQAKTDTYYDPECGPCGAMPEGNGADAFQYALASGVYNLPIDYNSQAEPHPD